MTKAQRAKLEKRVAGVLGRFRGCQDTFVWRVLNQEGPSVVYLPDVVKAVKAVKTARRNA